MDYTPSQTLLSSQPHPRQSSSSWVCRKVVVKHSIHPNCPPLVHVCSRDGATSCVWPVIARSLVRFPGEATISGWTHTLLRFVSRYYIGIIHRNKRCWHRYVPRETSVPLKIHFPLVHVRRTAPPPPPGYVFFCWWSNMLLKSIHDSMARVPPYDNCLGSPPRNQCKIWPE